MLFYHLIHIPVLWQEPCTLFKAHSAASAHPLSPVRSDEMRHTRCQRAFVHFLWLINRIVKFILVPAGLRF